MSMFFDVTTTVSALSALASLLGGFALTIIILIVGNFVTDDDDNPVNVITQRTLSIMSVVALFDVLCAAMWGLTTGDTSGSIRPLILNLFTYIVFCLAAIEFIGAIILFIPPQKIPHILLPLRQLIFVTVLTNITSALLFHLEILRLQQNLESFSAVLSHNPILLLLISGLTLIPAGIGGWLNRSGWDKRLNLESWKSFKLFISTLMLWVILMTGGFIIYRYSLPGLPLSHTTMILMDGSFGLLIGWFLIFLP